MKNRRNAKWFLDKTPKVSVQDAVIASRKAATKGRLSAVNRRAADKKRETAAQNIRDDGLPVILDITDDDLHLQMEEEGEVSDKGEGPSNAGRSSGRRSPQNLDKMGDSLSYEGN